MNKHLSFSEITKLIRELKIQDQHDSEDVRLWFCICYIKGLKEKNNISNNDGNSNYYILFTMWQ